jgi:transcriptional regulator with XRE-family HTH domain
MSKQAESTTTPGERLRAARTAKGWSLTELSQRTGDRLSKSRISNYEQGLRQMSPDVAAMLAEALGSVAAPWLLCEDSPALSREEVQLAAAWRRGDEAMRAWLSLAIESDSPAEPPEKGDAAEPLAARLRALNLATRARAVQEQVGRRWPFLLLHLHRFTGERNQSFWHCTRHGRRFKASAIALLHADTPPCPGCQEDARPDRLAASRSLRRMGLSGEALQEHLKQVDELLDAERAAIYRGWAAGRTLAEIGAAAGITAEGARQRLKRLAADHPALKLRRAER